MDKKSVNFILKYDGADSAKLLFSLSKEKDIDIRMLASCIEARKKIKNKVPLWYEVPSLMYPTSLPIEQCSSQTTAKYKTTFINEDDTVADLTGGLGIDSFFFSKKAAKVDYFERSGELAEIANHNFQELGSRNIYVNNLNIDVSYFEINNNSHYNLVYLDPARRDTKGGKIADFTQCEPNFLELKEAIFTITDKVLIKFSPMEDISAALKLLPETIEVHIISVKNDCKEMLFLLRKNATTNVDDVKIYCINDNSTFSFTKREEAEAKLRYCNLSNGLQGYLYEPFSCIMKGAPFRLLCDRFGLLRLNASTNLYFSDSTNRDFPGKMFKILEMIPFKKSNYKYISDKYSHSSVTAKNLPMTSEEIRKLLKLDDGESYHLFVFECGDRSRFRSERFLLVTEPVR